MERGKPSSTVIPGSFMGRTTSTEWQNLSSSSSKTQHFGSQWAAVETVASPNLTSVPRLQPWNRPIKSGWRIPLLAEGKKRLELANKSAVSNFESAVSNKDPDIGDS